LSAAYQSFGQVDQTLIGVQVDNYDNLPFCLNTNQPSDGQFATGVQPPYRRGVKHVELNNTRYEYKTAGNRTILSLTGPLAIGDKLFIPNASWQTNPKAAAVLNELDESDPNDVCTGSAAQLEAASRLTMEELGEYDSVVQVM